MKKELDGVHIIRNKERIASLLLTVTAHTKNSVREQALRCVYTEILLSGAGAYSREAWQDALGTLGATISISQDDGNINFSLQCLDTALPKTLKLFEVLFQDPHFAESELTRIKVLITNMLHQAKEDARGHALRTFIQNTITAADRRSEFSLTDFSRAVDTVTIAALSEFHRTLWNYDWLYTVGGSDTSVAHCKKSITQLQTLHTSEPVSTYQICKPIQTEKVIVSLHDIPSKQNIEFSIGASIPMTRAAADYPAFVFGMSVLGIYGGFTGRLMSTVREKEGLTYGIYGRTELVTTHEEGVWRIMTFFNPKDAPRGIASTLREIALMHKKGITEDELTRFKNILHTRFTLTEDSLLKKIAEAHGLRVIGVTEEAYAEFKKSIQRLTCEEVNRVMKKYLDPKRLIISGAGPIASVAKELKQYAS